MQKLKKRNLIKHHSVADICKMPCSFKQHIGCWRRLSTYQKKKNRIDRLEKNRKKIELELRETPGYSVDFDGLLFPKITSKPHLERFVESRFENNLELTNFFFKLKFRAVPKTLRSNNIRNLASCEISSLKVESKC